MMSEQQQPFVLTRRSIILAGAAFGAVALAPRIARADAAVDELLGAWTFSGGKAERDALEKAIDDAVGSISVLVRKLAREKLQQANPVPEKLTFAADKLSLMLAYDGELFAAPLDGKAVQVKTSAGEALALRIEREGGNVDQVFAGEGKSRKNRLLAKGEKLTIDVTVRAEELPKPMRYRLTYKRSA